MAKSIKRILSSTICLALMLAMLCLGGCETYIGDSKQHLENLNITSELTKSGDMNVTETWKINLKDRNKAYRYVYKTIKLDQSKYDGIENVSVYDEDNKIQYKMTDNINHENASSNLENACYEYIEGDQVEIGLFMPRINEGVRTFTFHYTFKNCVDVYDDVSVLYSQFIGTDFSLPIANMNCTINFPSGAKKDDFRAWLHCTAQSKLTINSNNQISFTATKIPTGTQVETRICAPKNLFASSSRIKSGSVLSKISTDEKKWADDWAAKQKWNYILGIIDAIGGAVLLILGIMLCMIAKRKGKRYEVEVPEYTREIPESNSPAGIANLFYYYSGDITSRKGNLFSSTLLQLARKGYVQFESHDKNDFRVILTVKAKTANITDLTKGEQVFFELVSAVANDSEGSFTMKQFEAYAKIHYKFVDNTVNNFLAKSKEEIASRGYYEKKNQFSSTVFGFGTFLAILGIVALMFTRLTLVYLPTGAILCGILMIIGGCGKARLSKTGEYDYKVWHGLKKYMLEFSRMKEYGVPQLELWEEYLVYATMMGISKQVCDQLKMVYPQINDSDYMNTYWGNSYLYFMLGSHYGGFGGIGSNDLGSMLSNRMTTISQAATTLANPPSSSGGGFGGGGFGGGGFSGGGGGFGGGGGGVG